MFKSKLEKIETWQKRRSQYHKRRFAAKMHKGKINHRFRRRLGFLPLYLAFQFIGGFFFF